MFLQYTIVLGVVTFGVLTIFELLIDNYNIAKSYVDKPVGKLARATLIVSRRDGIGMYDSRRANFTPPIRAYHDALPNIDVNKKAVL